MRWMAEARRAGCLGALCVCAVGLAAPTDIPAKFEVASVRPSADCLDYAYRPLPGGGLYASGVSLKLLIVLAYEIQPFQLSGGPKWVEDDCWTIQATAKGIEGTLKLAQQAPMLRALLEDRFRLEFRHDSKEGPVYNLVVARQGPKLKPHPAGSPAEMRAFQDSWSMKDVAIATLAARLARELKRPVIDKTGLTGKYDLQLEFARETGAETGNRLSIFTALQDQLGLKLEAAKGAVDVLVIDRVEKPAAN